MALIDSAVLLGIADRASAQYGLVKVAFDSINATGGGFYWQRVTETDDPDVEIPLLSTLLSSDNNLTLYNAVRSGCTALTQIVTAMDSHFNRVSQSGSWDGYLTAQDERVSNYFNQIYYASKGQYMLANNVFSEDTHMFARIDITAGPTLNYTDGTNFGNGSASNRASGSYFAATQLYAKVIEVGGAGPGTADDIDITLTVKDEDNATTTVDFTISAGAVVDDTVDIGTSSDRFLDVVSAAFTNPGDRGTAGDHIRIYNKKERSVAL